MPTEEKIEVMQAFAEGKTIQSKAVIGEHWCDDSNPSWDWNHFEYRVKQEPVTGNVEGLKRSLKQAFNALDIQNKQNEELKENIKSLQFYRSEMAKTVSADLMFELTERCINAKHFDDLQDELHKIAEFVQNKILDYKSEKKLRRMTYKELDDWLEQGKGVVRIANRVSNTISYDCEDRNKEVYGGYKICGYDEDTWHYPMIEV